MAKHYTLKPQVIPLPKHAACEAEPHDAPSGAAGSDAKALDVEGPGSMSDQPADDPFVRAEAEDDDGYDPYSDRPPAPEPLFEENPWD